MKRTSAARGVSPEIACKLKTDEDVSDWTCDNDENSSVKCKYAVSENYSVTVR